METVTRFAPSPTGSLHTGGVRTALYSWLYAKKMKGRFILRIEDTDRVRSGDESVQQIIDTMQWLGLDYHAIYYQSQRDNLYQKIARQLLEQDKAYYCHCSIDRLNQLRNQQMIARHKPRYDGRCRNLSLGNSDRAVIRLRAPQDGHIEFNDALRKTIRINNNELDDLILMRSDGSPTYNFSCVIDDAEMGITLVMRGDDHLNNTPRQIHIYNSLGYKMPTFAHLPMILGTDGKRLSKRHGALSALEYKNLGYLPDALLNYLARLGWSYGDQEIFSRQQLIDLFTLETISKSPASYSTEKLLWTNKQHLKTTPLHQIISQLSIFMPQGVIDAQIKNIIPLYLERSSTLKQLATALSPYRETPISIDEKAANKNLKPAAIEPLLAIRCKLQQLETWQPESLRIAIEQVARELGLGMGKVGMPLRVAITGSSFSPSLDQVLACIKKTRVLDRIDTAIAYIENRIGDKS